MRTPDNTYKGRVRHVSRPIYHFSQAHRARWSAKSSDQAFENLAHWVIFAGQKALK
jgi:hypothetical protein